MATAPIPEQQQHSISENLEAIRTWLQQTDVPAQRASIPSIMRSAVFVGSPVLVAGYLGYLLTQSASSSADDHCVCPDGGVRSGISRQRLVD